MFLCRFNSRNFRSLPYRRHAACCVQTSKLRTITCFHQTPLFVVVNAPPVLDPPPPVPRLHVFPSWLFQYCLFFPILSVQRDMPPRGQRAWLRRRSHGLQGRKGKTRSYIGVVLNFVLRFSGVVYRQRAKSSHQPSPPNRYRLPASPTGSGDEWISCACSDSSS